MKYVVAMEKGAEFYNTLLAAMQLHTYAWWNTPFQVNCFLEYPLSKPQQPDVCRGCEQTAEEWERNEAEYCRSWEGLTCLTWKAKFDFGNLHYRAVGRA